MLMARLSCNDAHAQAWLSMYVYEVSFAKVRSLIGMGGDQPMPQVTPELTKDEGDGSNF